MNGLFQKFDEFSRTVSPEGAFIDSGESPHNTVEEQFEFLRPVHAGQVPETPRSPVDAFSFPLMESENERCGAVSLILPGGRDEISASADPAGEFHVCWRERIRDLQREREERLQVLTDIDRKSNPPAIWGTICTRVRSGVLRTFQKDESCFDLFKIVIARGLQRCAALANPPDHAETLMWAVFARLAQADRDEPIAKDTLSVVEDMAKRSHSQQLSEKDFQGWLDDLASNSAKAFGGREERHGV
jgi:hypothetical protein